MAIPPWSFWLKGINGRALLRQPSKGHPCRIIFPWCSTTLLATNIKELETYFALFIFLDFCTVCWGKEGISSMHLQFLKNAKNNIFFCAEGFGNLHQCHHRARFVATWLPSSALCRSSGTSYLWRPCFLSKFHLNLSKLYTLWTVNAVTGKDSLERWVYRGWRGFSWKMPWKEPQTHVNSLGGLSKGTFLGTSYCT